MMQFEAIAAEDYPKCQLITLQLFARGGPMREQVLCVVMRTHKLAELPALSRHGTACAHAPCAEQSIERRHAAIRAGTRAAPNHTTQYDSVRGLRKRELVDIFDDSAEAVKELATVMDTCARSPAMCIQSLGLAAHPNFQKYVKDSADGFHSVPHDVAAEVIYRADWPSLSLRIPSFQYPGLPPYLLHSADGDGAFQSRIPSYIYVPACISLELIVEISELIAGMNQYDQLYQAPSQYPTDL